MLQEYFLLLFYCCVPIVAFLYASVGHGGASGYLALMALFSFPTLLMKPSALLLNIIVAGISFFYFYRAGYFKWKLFYPFALSSIPASFLGGYINVNPSLYKQILGVLLIFAILRILGIFGEKSDSQTKEAPFILSLVIGACIGFFSGMIGIGGGIILSPLILLFNWGEIKETAAVSALFIWVNSIAGMSGLLLSGVQLEIQSFYMVILALIGGALGGYYGSSKKINSVALRYILAFVLAIASFKLIMVY